MVLPSTLLAIAILNPIVSNDSEGVLEAYCSKTRRVLVAFHGVSQWSASHHRVSGLGNIGAVATALDKKLTTISIKSVLYKNVGGSGEGNR